jgi:hypothetical protein
MDGGVVMVEMTLLGLAAGDCLEHVVDRLTFGDRPSRH